MAEVGYSVTVMRNIWNPMSGMHTDVTHIPATWIFIFEELTSGPDATVLPPVQKYLTQSRCTQNAASMSRVNLVLT